MSRRTNAGLSRERVLRAGLQVIDRDGVDALTMRRLGQELGVKAMSLYGYVDNKQDLLEGVLECVYAEVPRYVGDSGSWQGRLRGIARVFRQVLLRHPNAVPLVAARPVPTNRATVGLVQSALGELRHAGLDLVSASAVVTVVVSFTVGHVASEVGRNAPPANGYVGVGVSGNGVSCNGDSNGSGDHAATPDSDTEFDLGLDFIVAGVERLLQPLANA